MLLEIGRKWLALQLLLAQRYQIFIAEFDKKEITYREAKNSKTYENILRKIERRERYEEEHLVQINHGPEYLRGYLARVRAELTKSSG